MAQLVVPLAISTGLNLLASLFTPKPKEQEVDLRVPRSDYGSPLVKIYGRVRIEGNKFWPDTKEKMYRKSSSRSKGKGGLGSGKGKKTTEYFGTFAVLFCQGTCNMERLIINGDNYIPEHPYYQEYVSFFKGDQTTPWSEMTAKDEVPYKNIAYTNICYVGFTDLPLEKYGNQIPQQISAVLVDDEFGDNPLLTEVITSICERAGIDSSLIDVTGLGTKRLEGGLILPESGEGYRKALEDLFQIFMLTAYETKEGIIKFISLGSAVTGVGVNLTDFFPVSGNGVDNKLFTRTEVDPTQLPSQVSIKFFNSHKNHNSDEVSVYSEEFPELTTITALDYIKDNSVSIDSRIFTTPYQMRISAKNLLFYLHKQQKYEYNLKIPATALSGIGIEPLSTIGLPNGETVQIESMSLGNDFLIDIKGRYFAGTNDYNNPAPPPITPPVTPDPTTDIPELYVVDIPTFKENTPPGTLYIFARKPCVVLVSIDNGASYLKEVNHEGVSTYGNVLSVLANGSGLDTVNTVDIELESGEVNSITNAQLTANLNLAVIGTLSGGIYEGEIIQFRDVEVLTSTTFRLSYLNRGLFRTENFSGSHALPQKFFLLTAETGAYYSELQGDSKYVGETLTLLPVVATYQNLATTPTYTVTAKGNSYRPFSPTNATGSIDAQGNIQLFWEYSASYSPFNNSSQDVTYDVEIIKPDTSVRLIQSSEKQCNYLIADRTTDGVVVPLNVRIYAVSQVVGRGEPLIDEITPIELPNQIIGTGGGLSGIKFVTAHYTVTENDLGYVIVVETSLVEEIYITFPSTLSNGFYCYVVNSQENNLSALATIVTPNSYTLDTIARIPNGKSRSVIHVSGGYYFIEGENSLLYDFNSQAVDEEVLGNNVYYEVDGNFTFYLPESPRESNIIGIKGKTGVNFANTPTVINGNGKNIEGNPTYTLEEEDERILFYFNGTQWTFISRYILNSGGGTGLSFAYYDTNFTPAINTINAVNSATTPVVATLPTTPPAGTIIGFYDYSSNFDVNNLTINSGLGDNILGNSNLILDTANSTVQLVYHDHKWSVFGTEIFVDKVGSGGGGVTEIPYSTDAQAIAETATDKVITPANLGAWKEHNKFITESDIATTDKEGIVKMALLADVLGGLDPYKYITPFHLEQWRIENNLIKTAITEYTIYVSTNAYHSLSGSLRGTIEEGKDPNHGDSVTYFHYNLNVTNPANEGSYWQVFDPDSPNFRCFKTLKDVADYGNAKVSSQEFITLYMDAGKYECNYTFNFGLKVNGVNNTGINGWGNYDNSDNNSLIFYTTSDYSFNTQFKHISYSSKSMVINSEATTQIEYVHFWSWVTATKDSTLTWGNGLKKANENTIEQHFLNIDQKVFDDNPTLARCKYLGSYFGLGGYKPLIRLKNSGDKIFNYCSFSGVGTSAPKINIDDFRGGYIFVENKCKLRLKGIIFRGNETIRISDKRGRYITTPLSPTPVYIPPNNAEKADDTEWEYEPVYDVDGNFLTSNYYSNFNFTGVVHDPYSEEFVSIGFCDIFLGINKDIEVDFAFSEGFFTGLNYFGSIQPAPFNSDQIAGSYTINHDLKCIRIEKNQNNLFGTYDDRIIGGATSVNLTGSEKFRFRGTNILGEKMANLYPPTLTYANGDVANKNAVSNTERDEFQEWLSEFESQGSTIRNFINSLYNFTLTNEEYSLWADRTSNNVITGQGFLGQFGYLLQTDNLKLQPIFAYDYFSNSSPYGKGLNWNQKAVASKLSMGTQYQYNIFKSGWTGFSKGKYLNPVYIDVGVDYATLLGEVNSNPPDFSSIQDLLITEGHLLNGKIVGARFIFVGDGANESFGLMYLGYSNDTPTDHYFIKFGDNFTGVEDYKTSTVLNTISEISTLSGTIEKIYIKNANLLLSNENYNNDVTDIINWQPMIIPVNDLPIYNAYRVGLIGNNYRGGFHLDYGINVNLSDNTNITPVQVTQSISTIYNNTGYPFPLNTASSDYDTLLALLSSGFSGATKLEGFSVILPSSTIQITG